MAAMRQGMAKGRNEKDDDLRLTFGAIYPNLRPVFEDGSNQTPPNLGVCVMAKPATLQIKLVSTADTGYFYVTKKNPRTKPEKLELKKYDPRARKHVIFRESKIK